jgi:hypothetical protein
MAASLVSDMRPCATRVHGGVEPAAAGHVLVHRRERLVPRGGVCSAPRRPTRACGQSGSKKTRLPHGPGRSGERATRRRVWVPPPLIDPGTGTQLQDLSVVPIGFHGAEYSHAIRTCQAAIMRAGRPRPGRPPRSFCWSIGNFGNHACSRRRSRTSRDGAVSFRSVRYAIVLGCRPAGRPCCVQRRYHLPETICLRRLNRSLLADGAPVSNFDLVEMAIYAGGCPARQHRAICVGGRLKRPPAQRPSVLAVP